MLFMNVVKSAVMAAALAISVASAALAGQAGHVVYDAGGGSNTYLAPDERMYDGDYMVADHHPAFGEPLVVKYVGGDLQVWWNCYDMICDGDPAGQGHEGWWMLWHSNTYTSSGFFYNGSDGNACVWDNNTSRPIWCTNTSGGNSYFYAAQFGTTPSCKGYAFQLRASDWSGTWFNPGAYC